MGERVTQARRAAKLSRRALADAVGLRLWDVEQIETGQSESPDDLLPAIADALGVSPVWLRTGADVRRLDERREHDDLADRQRELAERERELVLRETDLARREAELARREGAAADAFVPPPQVEAIDVDTLARLITAYGASYPDRMAEWQATLVAMRSVVGVDGRLTPELETLAREIFAPLLRGAA